MGGGRVGNFKGRRKVVSYFFRSKYFLLIVLLRVNFKLNNFIDLIKCCLNYYLRFFLDLKILNILKMFVNYLIILLVFFWFSKK